MPGYILFRECYGPDSLQTLDVHLPSHDATTSDKTWLIFIHGGAWRDPRNSKSDATRLFHALIHDPHASRSLNLCGATINYRLSYHSTRPEAYQPKHPDHLNDVASAIAYLQDRYKFGGNYVIIGHSCGATLGLQYVGGVDRRWYQNWNGGEGGDGDDDDDDIDINIDIDIDVDDNNDDNYYNTIDNNNGRDNNSNNYYYQDEHEHEHNTAKIIDIDTQSLTQQLLQSTIATSQAKRHLPRLIVCTEGIYNLISLIEEYPSYYSFVDKAFGPISNIWQEASPVNFFHLPNDMDTVAEGGGGRRRRDDEVTDNTDNNNNNDCNYTGRLVLVQSSEDELLSMRQTEEFAKVLQGEKGKKKKNNNNVEIEIVKGKHDDVFKSEELVTIMMRFMQELKMDMGELKSSLE